MHMYIRIHRSYSSPLLSRSSDPATCIKSLQSIDLNDSAFFENENNASNIQYQKFINNSSKKMVTNSQKLKEHDYVDLMTNPLTISNLNYHKATVFPPSQENKASYVESFIKQQKRIFENEVEIERKIKEEIQSIVSFDISHNNNVVQDWLSTPSNSDTNDSKSLKYNPLLLKQNSILYINKNINNSHNSLENTNNIIEEEKVEEKSENILLTNKVKNISAIKNKCLQILSRWIKPKYHYHHYHINKYKKDKDVVDNNGSNIKIIISPTIVDDYSITQNIHSLKINKLKRSLSWSINTPLEEYRSGKGLVGSSSSSPLLSPPLPKHREFQFKNGNMNNKMAHDFQIGSKKSNVNLLLPRIDLTSASSQSSQSSSSMQKYNNCDNSYNNKSNSPSLFGKTTSTVSSKQNEDSNYKKITSISFLQRTLSNAKKIHLKSTKSKKNQNQKNISVLSNKHDYEVDIKNNKNNNMENGLEINNNNNNNHSDRDDHEFVPSNNNNSSHNNNNNNNNNNNIDNKDIYDDKDDKESIGLYTAKNKSTHFEEIYTPKLKSFNEEEIASSVMKNSGLDYFQFPKMDPIQVKI
ncbi:unnamed protein product [Cunninghamella blakesleeana]